MLEKELKVGTFGETKSKMLLFSIISPFLKLGWKVIKAYLLISLFFICWFFTIFIVGIASNSKQIITGGNLAPVALGNPFLPYRDITPNVSTAELHGYTAWTGGTLSGTWEGIDYSTPEGTPLYAPFVCPCVVESVGFDNWVGPYDTNPDSKGTSYILLSTEDGQYKIMYQHGIYTVKPGNIVAPGVQIGTEASIGNSTGAHTHVAIKKNNVAIAANEYDNTAFVAKTGTKSISHTGKSGNYGSVLQSYENVQLSMSHYDPSLGGINCDSDCTTMASGEKVSSWVLGQDGKYAAACPQEWPSGTEIRVDDITFVCKDTGGYINCYNIGDYDPAYKANSTVQHCWIDALGSFGYTYGQLVPSENWGFITK